jgi:hypothetical protein
VLSDASAAGPFEKHLRDALALNRKRADSYAELSAGASRPISRTLIAAELVLLPVARWFDYHATPYHAAGIPVLETLFVPIATVPAMSTSRNRLPGDRHSTCLRAADIRRHVGSAYRCGSFAAAATALDIELATLRDDPHFNCLVRHLLESAHRLACLAPAHLALARERGLASPSTLLGQLLWLHLWGLTAAAALDKRARPLQEQGIAILEQDLPPIPGAP